MRDSRQITVLRSLFATLHPKLKSSLATGLAPARRLLTGAQPQAGNEPQSAERSERAKSGVTGTSAKVPPKPLSSRSSSASSSGAASSLSSSSPLPRSLTDEHLVTELDNITRQFELPEAPREPKRGTRHYSRDTLLSLLEEAKVRIQVLETELELARGTEEGIPLLTEEWSDDLPSTFSRKPD